jgi:hypothetical protein
MARKGDTVAPGLILDFDCGWDPQQSSTSSGIAFRTYVSGPNANTLDSRIYFGGTPQSAPGDATQLQLVARRYAPVPDTSGNLTTGLTYDGLQPPKTSNSGVVYFNSTVVGPGVNTNNNSAWFYGTPGAVQMIARYGSPAPQGGTIQSISIPDVNDLDEILINIANVNGHAVYAGNPETLALITKVGDPAPGTDFTFSGVAGVRRTNSGENLLLGSINGVLGYWSASESGLRKVAMVGQEAAGAGPGVAFASIGSSGVVMNESGNIVFNATTSDGKSGVWAVGPLGEHVKIAMTGDTLDFGNGDMRVVTESVSQAGDSSLGSALNDNNILVLRASTFDGGPQKSAVFQTDLSDVFDSTVSIVGSIVNITSGGSAVVDTIDVGNSSSTGDNSQLTVAAYTSIQSTNPVSIHGNGAVTVYSGSTITAPSIAVSGSLWINGVIVGDVYLSEGGTIGGIGSVTGTIYAADGSVISIGNSPGELAVDDFVFESGNHDFEVELADAEGSAGDDWDLLNVSGNLSFEAGATINIDLNSLAADGQPGMADNFESTQAYAWTIASADSITGFDLATFLIDASAFVGAGSDSFSIEKQLDDILLLYEPASVLENGDGIVDAADYVVWRKLGSSQPQYDAWRSNFGDTLGQGGGAGFASSQPAVPEPATALLLCLGVFCCVASRRV